MTSFFISRDTHAKGLQRRRLILLSENTFLRVKCLNLIWMIMNPAYRRSSLFRGVQIYMHKPHEPLAILLSPSGRYGQPSEQKIGPVRELRFMLRTINAAAEM